MLLKKEGYPADDELVLCTVTNVQFHSVFCKLDEYTDKSGMIHISEIAPGRIKNIREFVAEGKKIVCKVLQINRERGHIDLSLRRVNEGQRRTKLSDLKNEQFAEKILEHVAKSKKMDPKLVYTKVRAPVFAKYPGLYPAFEAAARDEEDLTTLGIDAALSKDITDAVKAKIKPPEVALIGDFRITTTAPDGIEIVKGALNEALQVKGDLSIKYKGGGTYHIVVKSDDFKKAEKVLKEAVDGTLAYAEKHKAVAEFKRQE
ncbi:translation initiation factor IF-2 subunit alpha [Candidatus Woesearchaeota archaeon]|nr:translation initiation factor IF-2 subunit alpha [Candidatus Woesearchaeota archaeon]